MKRIKSLGAVFVALSILGMFLAPLAEASNCRRRVARKRVVVRKRVIVRRVFFGIPLYAAYAPPAAAPCPNPAPKTVRRAAPRQTYAPPAEEESPPPSYAPPARRAPPKGREVPLPGYDSRTDGPPARYQAPPPYPSARYNTGAPGDDRLDRILALVETQGRRLDRLERSATAGGAKRGAKRAAPDDNGNNDDNNNDDDDDDNEGPTQNLKKGPKEVPPKKANRNGKLPTRARVAAILNRACAMCHSSERAAEHGKNFVLFQGSGMVILDAEDKKAIEDELQGLSMPPRPVPPLARAEREVALAWLRDPRTS